MNIEEPRREENDPEATQPQPFLPDDEFGRTLPYTPDLSFGDTQPVRPVPPADPLSDLQPVRIQPGSRPAPTQPPPPPPPAWPAADPYQPRAGRTGPLRTPSAARPPARRTGRSRFGCLNCGCLTVGALFFLLLVYFLAPLRTNLLVLGIDRTPEGTYAGRSDTNILVTVSPLKPTVAMLSIPRDLWVTLPGVGEQRINTAHYFAELEEPGSGPLAAAEAVESVFQVRVPYYVRLRFDSLVGIVEAMGGVDVTLPEPMAGYEAGTHHMNGEQALAFARSRAGADDFYRMEQGQLLLRSVFRQAVRPASWGQLPAIARAGLAAVDTNLPFWQWPRLGLALLRAGPDGIESRTLDRDMVTPWTTEGGAQVLLPNWDAIYPFVHAMFGSSTLRNRS